MNTRNGEGVVCAKNVVRVLLPVGDQVAIGRAVAGQILVPHGTGAVKTKTVRGGGAGVCPCGPLSAPGPSPRCRNCCKRI